MDKQVRKAQEMQKCQDLYGLTGKTISMREQTGYLLQEIFYR
jgi:hypothetical protein